MRRCPRAASSAHSALTTPTVEASPARQLILTLSCPDARGIVARVAGLIAAGDGNIIDSHQFGDPDAGRFFMRIHFDAGGQSLEDWREAPSRRSPPSWR